MNNEMKKYSLIYADPPWSFRDKCNSGKRGASHKYPVMKLADLRALPVPTLAAENCLLAMWWVSAMPKEAIELAEAWGFKVKLMLGFNWEKLTKKGKRAFLMGHYTRGGSEACLFAVKGSPKIVNHSVRQVIIAKQRKHSQKPDETRERLVQMLGDVPRLEMFARETTTGWDVFGNQVEGSIQLPT
jgi:N6-adenosine-specific RNA methylase IME4